MLLESLQNAAFSAPLFDIYSIGDATYMQHVMNAIAMMGKYIITLGKAGLLIGLVLIVGKGIATGGQKFEIAWFFVGLLVFMFMFGSVATVQIHEKGGAPGTVPDTVKTVDNVPIGVAIMGWAVSGMGYDMAQWFSTATSTPGAGDAGAGFGRSLKWLNAVRNWDLPELDDDTHRVSSFRSNALSYLSDCTLLAARQGKLDLNLALQAKDPFVVGSNQVGGILTNDAFATTRIRDPNAPGGFKPATCQEAGEALAASAKDSALLTAFANALAPRNMKVNGIGDSGGSATAALEGAFQAIGQDANYAQDYVVNSALLSAWADMTSGSMGTSKLDALSSIMMTTAAQQRAQQWAGEENMFRRIARPMTAFFESMIYALAPFMAFAIGLGAFGFKMLVRYLVLSIWVTLWAPIMALVDLFQNTMVRHSLDAMAVNNSLATTSLAGTAYLQNQIIDWISVGATLAAATPMLSLSILFGGAYTATALATRLQGGDHINERIASPDPVQISASQAVLPGHATDPIRNTQIAGSSGVAPMVTLNDATQHAEQSAFKAYDQAKHSFAAAHGHDVATQYQRILGVSGSSGSIVSAEASKNMQALSTKLESRYSTMKHLSSAQQSEVLAAASRWAANTPGSLGDVPIPVQAGYSKEQQTAFQQVAQDMRDHGEQVLSELRTSTGYGASDAVRDMAQAVVKFDTTDSANVANADSFKEDFADMQGKERSWQLAESATSSKALSQGMDVQAMAQNFDDPEKLQRLRERAMDTAGAAAVTANREWVQTTRWGSGSGSEAMAYLISLDGQGPGRTKMLRGEAAEGARQAAMYASLEDAGFVGAGNPALRSVDPSRYGDAGSGAHFGAGQRRVSGHALGTTKGTEASVTGDVEAGLSDPLRNKDTAAVMAGQSEKMHAAETGVRGADSGSLRATFDSNSPAGSKDPTRSIFSQDAHNHAEVGLGKHRDKVARQQAAWDQDAAQREEEGRKLYESRKPDRE